MNSDQLVLRLGMPWDGISPRYLTRGRLILSLASEGTGRLIPEPNLATVDPLQTELLEGVLRNGS